MCAHRKFLLVSVFLLAVGTLAAQIAEAQLPVIRPQQRLPLPPPGAPRPAEPALFGELALTDGQTILVTVDEGPAAYTYVRNSAGRWVYESALVAPEGTTSISGAVRGNVAVIHGRVAETNVVFVFLRSQGQWTHTQTIAGSTAIGGANSLALGGDFLAIGDLEANDFVGAVHIYSETGAGTYAFDSSLSPAGAVQGWLVGYHVIADGNTVLAAAPGAAMVIAFARNGGLWSEEGQLLPDRFMSGWFFGFSGNRAFLVPLGRTENDPFNPQEFVRSSGTWLKGDELNHPFEPLRELANPLALNGKRLLVAEGGSESVLLFEFEQNGRWRATAKLSRANDASCPPFFDSGTLSLVGTLAIAACPDVPTGNPVFDGQVLIYELPRLK